MPEPYDLQQVLDGCRLRLGNAPRHPSLWEQWSYLNTPMPKWAEGDRLESFFLKQKNLFQDGIVVWAHIVQANQMLFKPGLFNCPGEVVYGTDFNETLPDGILSALAHRLYLLKAETAPHVDEQFVGDYLANERVRVFGLPVPASLTSHKCAISTIYFNRRHMPHGVLKRSLIPIIVSQTGPGYAMLLPSRYWPESLRKVWGGSR